MKKLLLTSAGFLNKKVADAFLDLVTKKPSEMKIIFIPTASRTKEELFYVKESKKELLDLGIERENIKELSLDHKISHNEVEGYDVMYVCGGNMFYLLKKVRESGFDEIIKKFIDQSGVYLGVSAGSMLVSLDVSVAAPWDKNDVNLTDTRGLNIVNFCVSPHYVEDEKEIVENLRKKFDFEIKILTDHQAVLVRGDKVEVIGGD